MAGFSQQLLGHFDVLLRRLLGDRKPGGERHRIVGAGFAEAEQHRVDHRLTVDDELQRLAHLEVVEGRRVDPHRHRHRVRGARLQQLDIGIVLEAGMTDGSTLSTRSTWPALIADTAATGSCATVTLRHLGLRLAGIPVVRVSSADAHRRVRLELLLHERPGAVLMQPQLLMLGAFGTILVNLLVISTGSSTTGFLVVKETVYASTALMPSGSRNSSTALAPEPSSGSKKRLKV